MFSLVTHLGFYSKQNSINYNTKSGALIPKPRCPHLLGTAVSRPPVGVRPQAHPRSPAPHHRGTSQLDSLWSSQPTPYISTCEAQRSSLAHPSVGSPKHVQSQLFFTLTFKTIFRDSDVDKLISKEESCYISLV